MSENSAAATPLSPVALAEIELRAVSPSALINVQGDVLALVGEVRRLRAEIDAMKRAALAGPTDDELAGWKQHDAASGNGRALFLATMVQNVRIALRKATSEESS